MARVTEPPLCPLGIPYALGVPLPRAVLLSLLALILVAPLAASAPLVPDAMNGFGTALTFQVYGKGMALEGGAYEWTDICDGCLIRITVRDGTFVVSDSSNAAGALAPGVYELREFTGLFLFTQNAPRDFSVQLHGLGKANKIG